MKEFEKSIMAYIKIIIICKGFYPRERAPGTHWIGGWVGPRTGLDFVETRNILPTPAVQPVACRDATDIGVIRIPVVSQLHGPTVSSRRKSPRYSLDKRLGVSQTIALYSAVLIVSFSLFSRFRTFWASFGLRSFQSQSYFTTDDQSVSPGFKAHEGLMT
jgi:hypothetical protein